MIEVQQLSKRYGKHEVLRGLTFTAHPRQITLLLGANGAGKTTCLRTLSGLIAPDAGDALICGRSIVNDRRAAERLLSYLPQGISFHPRLSCRAVLRFYADLRGVGRQHVDGLLERVGLLQDAGKSAGALSGGLRQRLGLAVLLLADAPVLMLDEPGLSLDPEWRAHLQEILQKEAARGKTVLVTTHLLAEWEGVAHRSLLCHKGGTISEIDPQRLREEFAGASYSSLPAYVPPLHC
jgi:ABC-type multidrug transport system ATPase subunit